jgi:RNA polymerase-binding transcription factor DksA
MAQKKSAPKKITKGAKQNSKPVKKAAPVKASSKKTEKARVKKVVPIKKVATKPVAKKGASINKTAAKPAKTLPATKPVSKAKVLAKVVQIAVSKILTPKPSATSVNKLKKLEPPKEVKVPKTSIKTSVPYLPEYKSMEQRQGAVRNNVPLVRYNDADLAEFRELINSKMDRAKKELAYLQGLITRKDEMGGDEAESRYMTMEDGSMSMEREQLSQMASRQITYIDHLEKALIRIENKTYGICRVTGKLIDKARLRAVPHATLSLEAKLGIVKTSEQ